MKIFKNLLHILFPRRCVVCKTQDPDSLCDDCFKEIPLVKNTKGGSIVSVFPYRHPAVKYSIWEWKFKGNPNPVMRLLPTMYDVLLDELTERHLFNNFQKPLLVPVPLHITRHRARGFNQSEQLAQELCKQNPEVFDCDESILVRHKETLPQAKISNRQKRKTNVAGCFEVANQDALYNRNVILVDDITTTGSTLEEAMRTLKKGGARNVYAFTVAK